MILYSKEEATKLFKQEKVFYLLNEAPIVDFYGREDGSVLGVSSLGFNFQGTLSVLRAIFEKQAGKWEFVTFEFFKGKHDKC